MEINYTFNFWDNIFATISIVVSSFVAFWIYKLSIQLTAKDKFQHEQKITEELEKIPIYKNIILADITKYHSLRQDGTNKTYYKQGGALYTIIPEYGIQVILTPNDENIPVGLIPFDWIEYIRQKGDSEDSKPIIVCHFKGVSLFQYFTSPFKEIHYIYKNPKFDKDNDPAFLQYTTINPVSKARKGLWQHIKEFLGMS